MHFWTVFFWEDSLLRESPFFHCLIYVEYSPRFNFSVFPGEEALIIVITTNWCCCCMTNRPSEIFTMHMCMCVCKYIHIYSFMSSRESHEAITDLQCAQVLESIVAEKSTQVYAGKYVNSETCTPHTQAPSLMAVCIPYAFARTHKRTDILAHNVCPFSGCAEGEWERVRTERGRKGQVRGSRWLTMLMLLLMTWLWAIIDCLHYHISFSAFAPSLPRQSPLSQRRSGCSRLIPGTMS